MKAEYGGRENLAWPVDLFFRFDPLILAAQLLTFSPLVAGLFWSLVMVALTFVLGRFFCGWVCPLGTTLDGFRRLLFTPAPGSRRGGPLAPGQVLPAGRACWWGASFP